MTGKRSIAGAKHVDKIRKYVGGAGILVMIISVLLLALQVTLPSLEISIVLYKQPNPLNLTILLWLLLFIIGMLCATRLIANGTENDLHRNVPKIGTNINEIEQYHVKALYQDKNRKQSIQKSIKIYSFAWGRLLAAFLMGGVALWNLRTYGAATIQNNADGNWLFLGGPSLFYPTGVFPLLFALGLIIYSLISFSIIKISRTETDILVSQQRYFMGHFSNISRASITDISYSSSKMGAMYVWIFLLGIPAWLLLGDGLSFLTNPHTFGFGIKAGIHYTISATSLIVALILLMSFHPRHLQISTEINEYILRFTRIGKQKAFKLEFKEFFKDQKKDGLIENPNSLQDAIKEPRFQFGAIFLILGILSRIFRIYAGEPLAMTLALMGTVLMVRALKEGIISLQKRDEEKQNTSEFQFLGNIFDVIAMGSIFILALINSGMMFATKPLSSPSFGITLVSHVVGLGTVIYGVRAILIHLRYPSKP